MPITLSDPVIRSACPLRGITCQATGRKTEIAGAIIGKFKGNRSEVKIINIIGISKNSPRPVDTVITHSPEGAIAQFKVPATGKINSQDSAH